MDVARYNRHAWDAEVRRGNKWTVPVGPEVIARARQGDWSVLLTTTRPVPRRWFPASMTGVRVLGLASGGGQQGPVLAAAGAEVTVFDASAGQLGQDQMVAEREGLELELVQGDMRDLSRFEDGAFDLVFHPASNCFCPEIEPVWREAFRVLRPGGELLAGWCHPLYFSFGLYGEIDDPPRLKFAEPYADTTSLPEASQRQLIEAGEPFVFGHSFEAQIGGQLAAGFRLVDMYADRDETSPLAKYFPGLFATRAVKP
jgi:SAM-dependent methyltransferase